MAIAVTKYYSGKSGPAICENRRFPANHRSPANDLGWSIACYFRGEDNAHLDYGLRLQIMVGTKKNTGAADVYGGSFMPFEFAALAIMKARSNRKPPRTEWVPGRRVHSATWILAWSAGIFDFRNQCSLVHR